MDDGSKQNNEGSFRVQLFCVCAIITFHFSVKSVSNLSFLATRLSDFEVGRLFPAL